MAKDDASAGNSPAEIEELVRDCKKKPHNFALLKSKDGVVLKAHPLKSCEVMLRAAKDAGGLPAISMTGSMFAVGKVLELTLETEEFPGTLPKLAKKQFKAMKLPIKIAIILPNGQRIEDSDDDEELEAGEGEEEEVAEQVAEAAAEQGDPEAARKAALAARIKALVPAIRDAAAKGMAGVDKLSKAVQAAATEMANAGLDRAEQLLGAVEKQLGLGGGSPAPEDNEAGLRERLVQEFSDLGGDLRSLLQGADKAITGKATSLIGMFKTEIERDLKKSGQILSLLRAMAASELAKAPKADTASAPKADAKTPGQDEGLAAPNNDGAGDGNIFKKMKEAVKSVVGGGKADDKEKDKDKDKAKDEGIVEEALSLVDRISKAVTDGVNRAAEIVKDNAPLLAMAAKYPEAALAAKAALEAFDEKLGGNIEITPEVLERASSSTKAASDLLADANKALEVADAMKKGGKRNRAVKAAQQAVADAQAALTRAQEYEKAAKGKKLVTDAITTGPLSPTSPKSFSGGSALELIKGAGRDPDLTATAMESCRTGEHHEAVAQNLGKIINLKDAKFGADGKTLTDEYSAKYATKLLKMGGEVGPGYFDRMGDYMASGRQFIDNPTGETPAASFGELEQKRSMAVGRAMVKPDGSVDVTTDAARNALGDALFNPDVMVNPRPAMAAHMLRTVDFLKDPGNATNAGNILKGMPDPTDANAKSLVQRANGKGATDPVTKGDAQGAVMASMFKSLDQGPVGSCFSTAPTRRLRETDPLGAMKAYAQIAGTGKYKPPFGPEVAVVTNTPEGDDPVMRSWEYSLATSTAQRGVSSHKDNLASANRKGLSSLNDAIKARNLAGNDSLPEEEQKTKRREEREKARLRLTKLKADVAAAFTFVYDPADAIGDSSDGSSDRGRYILQRISPVKDIRTKDEFIEAMTAISLASLGIAEDAPDATLVKDHIKSAAFIDAVTKAFGATEKEEYLPWKLRGGGQTDEATQALHGETLAQTEMMPKAGDPPPDEATRTKDVLKGLMSGMSGKADKMVTIRTVGMHGFNALPNHPSLDKLKGDTQDKRDQAMENNLLKPGRDLRDTKIPKDKAVQMFMAELQPWLDGAKTPALRTAYEDGIKAHKPAADLTPPELTAAIKAASRDANKIQGDADAAKWKQDKVDAGETVTDEDFAKRKDAEAAAYEKTLTDKLTQRMMTDLGVPEFVIADANWGSGLDHTFFVVSPDPNTGEPVLWQKSVPPGTLTRATRDWIDAQWAKID